MNIEFIPINPNAERVVVSNAVLYCTFLDHYGKKGWRLPTESEVKEVFNQVKNCPGIPLRLYQESKVWVQSDLNNPVADNPNFNNGYLLAVRDIHEES